MLTNSVWPRRGHRRSSCARFLLPIVLCAVALVASGCGEMSSPTYDTSTLKCQGVSDDLLVAASSKLTVPGRLRNGKAVDGDSKVQFLSAELHRQGDDPHDKGDLLTFAVPKGDESALVAVDANAREDSSWPHASFDVRAKGARESRACADLLRGKTKAQIECEQKSGGPIPIPGKRDCGNL